MGNFFGRRGNVETDLNRKRSIPARFPLVHDLPGDGFVKPKQIIPRHDFLVLMFFNEPKARQLVQDLPASPFPCSQNRSTLFDGSNFFQSQGISFDRRGAMGCPYPGISLEKGNPRNLNGGGEDSLAIGRDFFDQSDEVRRDSKMGIVDHLDKSTISQPISQPAGRKHARGFLKNLYHF